MLSLEFNKLIKVCRKKAKLTQKSLAKQLNMSQNTISQYETGKRAIDSETMQIFIDFFEIEININTNKIITKHTKIFDKWNEDWRLIIQKEKELLEYFSKDERKFVEHLTFFDGHWFDKEDYDEGYHISILFNEEEFCIQKNEVYVTVTDYPTLSKDVFTHNSINYFETLLDIFELEKKLNELY